MGMLYLKNLSIIIFILTIFSKRNFCLFKKKTIIILHNIIYYTYVYLPFACDRCENCVRMPVYVSVCVRV